MPVTNIINCAAHRVPECIMGSGRCSSDPRLHLGEDVLDKVEVGPRGPTAEPSEWQQIVRHGAPGNPVADHIAQPVEQFAQIMPPLFRVLSHQNQIRNNQRPLFV